MTIEEFVKNCKIDTDLAGVVLGNYEPNENYITLNYNDAYMVVTIENGEIIVQDDAIASTKNEFTNRQEFSETLKKLRPNFKSELKNFLIDILNDINNTDRYSFGCNYDY